MTSTTEEKGGWAALDWKPPDSDRWAAYVKSPLTDPEATRQATAANAPGQPLKSVKRRARAAGGA